MKSINDRVNPIKEFKLTEKTYLNDIKGFDFNVGKVLKSGLLSESESSSLLSAMRPVVKITEEIYSDLEKMRLDYMTMIGKHFSAFIPYLKIYKNYISVYDSLQLKLAKSQNNPKNKNVLDEFSKTIYAGGRSLDSVLSIPFQRTMRYRMLLEAVLKKTPKVHPDHKFLIEAIEKLKTILLDVDRATNNVKKSQEMLQLNIRFEPLNIIKPQRSLIGCYQANGTNCEYTLIIFSDEFWVAKKLPENKLERKRVIQWSEANIQITSDLSVVISMFESYSQTFTFQDIKTRDGFIQQFRETAIYSNSAKSDIKITVQMTLSKFAMSNHSMVISDDFLWLFGGFDERGRLVNNLTILKISNHKCKILQQTENGEVWPCPRRDSAMGFAKNKVYVYGGNDGTQDLSDFWCYDVRKKKWINLDNEEGNIPGSGSGLQLTFVNDYFLLSGGKTEFEVYKYVISANEWTKMPLQTKYKALRHHSFIPKNDDSFLILGGVDLENHNNNDIMLYSNEILEPIDTTFLSPLCIYNTSLINDDYLFVFGGKEEPTPFLLSLRDFSWETPMVEKGQLSTLWDFTMSSYGSRVIILFGNNENGCSKAMYKLSFKLPDKCEGEKLLELINMNGRKRSKSISKK
ncbi:Kelch motif family protein [Histomonas meleagridis]|uniref:Kelch motif family protein n=1 Tax=Histomonas meleagridis TaxID=135588 RepID=UPI00355A7AB6|nr:Kelch motif family protein [Histomonas meleagridis]KAH0802926.1 Kelch motif family protein [Histomonas meleagridis]